MAVVLTCRFEQSRCGHVLSYGERLRAVERRGGFSRDSAHGHRPAGQSRPVPARKPSVLGGEVEATAALHSLAALVGENGYIYLAIVFTWTDKECAFRLFSFGER